MENLKLVNYKQALQLKNLKFNIGAECVYLLGHKTLVVDLFDNHNTDKSIVSYSNKVYKCIDAPPVVVALKWIRDEKKLIFNTLGVFNGKYGYRIFVKYHTEYDIEYKYSITNYESNDIAETELLNELLYILENK